MLSFIFFILMLILLIPLMYFNMFPTEHYELIFKTLCSLCFVLCSYCGFRKSNCNKKYFSLIFIGLIFCLLGDILLAFSGTKVFVLGAGSFALGHIFFVSGFIYLTSISLKDILLYIFLLTSSILLIMFKNGFNFGGMLPLVLIYTFIIVFMVTNALSLFKLRKENSFSTYLTILGALLFFISDIILLFLLYYKDCPSIFSPVNLLVYYLGQGLLALSFIKGFKKSG